MLFSSIVFLFYFLPLLLLVYYAVRFSNILKNIVLFCFSLIFYAWGNINFVFILILSIIFNYIFALLVDRYRGSKVKSRLILWLMCIFNLSTLFAFKYLVFASTILNDIFKISLNTDGLNFGLPIGISFFTLKAISYVVDVYTQKASVQRNPFYVALYIALFPQLIGGPVVQYSVISSQLQTRKESMTKFSIGCCRFITGLAKKVLVADNLAIVVDNIYEMNAIGTIPATLAWVGSIAYTLQIYYDFSGYIDMAIGVCLMFGLKIGESFNYPYMSKSITEFWRRWQISLGRWFRDYIYIPLGGSKLQNKDKIIRNLFVTWVLFAIWNGPEWTFLLWGLLNFAFILMEKLLSIHSMTTHNLLRSIYTLFVINILWVVFRADNLKDAGNFIASMFGFNGFYSEYSAMFIKEYLVFFVIGIVFSTSVAKKMNKFIIEKQPLYFIFNITYPVYMLAIFLITVTYLVKSGL